jgi:VanZ family protein
MKVNKTIAKILFVLYLAVLMYLCFGKFDGLPKEPRSLFGLEGDKVVHFLMFLPFPVLSYFAFPVRTRKAWHSLLLTAFILAVGSVFAAGTEFIQDFIPYREADTADFMADFIGLCVSAVSVLTTDLKKTLRHD